MSSHSKQQPKKKKSTLAVSLLTMLGAMLLCGGLVVVLIIVSTDPHTYEEESLRKMMFPLSIVASAIGLLLAIWGLILMHMTAKR